MDDEQFSLTRLTIFDDVAQRDGITGESAVVFFAKMWKFYVFDKRNLERNAVINERNLTDEEKTNLVNNAYLFCPALYRDFDTDDTHHYFLCEYTVLLGMRYYRVEFLPLILAVVQRRDDKDRIIASLHRHIFIEQAGLQLGKDRGKDRIENATWKERPDSMMQEQCLEVYKQFGDFSLKDEYSLTD